MVLRGSDHRDGGTGTPVEDQIDRVQDLKKIFTLVKRHLAKAHQTNASRYNLRRRPQEYTEGQQVWKRNFPQSDAPTNFSAKLAPKFSGPYVIRKKISPTVYQLSDGTDKDIGRWHVVDLKEYVEKKALC
jgi:hypothetical protein